MLQDAHALEDSKYLEDYITSEVNVKALRVCDDQSQFHVKVSPPCIYALTC